MNPADLAKHIAHLLRDTAFSPCDQCKGYMHDLHDFASLRYEGDHLTVTTTLPNGENVQFVVEVTAVQENDSRLSSPGARVVKRGVRG